MEQLNNGTFAPRAIKKLAATMLSNGFDKANETRSDAVELTRTMHFANGKAVILLVVYFSGNAEFILKDGDTSFWQESDAAGAPVKHWLLHRAHLLTEIAKAQGIAITWKKPVLLNGADFMNLAITPAPEAYIDREDRLMCIKRIRMSEKYGRFYWVWTDQMMPERLTQEQFMKNFRLLSLNPIGGTPG
ncbi:hypothetical protein [Alteromonas antoniana]|uniref:hypothetical protein n=1 Tax=Alteromonas antoniana TaxID=2803813 RepID=UPI001C4783A8|nr:hypothetical protein [Alteromonas antoniana]